MKQLNIIQANPQIIEDDEAENVKKQLLSGVTFIELRNGTIINVKVIASMSEVETEPYFMGNKMSKDKTKVFVNGEWKLFSGNSNDIKYLPKANNLKQIK